MKKLTGRTLMHLLLALFILVLIPGCGDVSGAPTIPPIETFLIPFEELTANETSSFVSVSEPFSLYSPLSGNQSNWNYAVLYFGSWAFVVVGTLAVPIAAYRESFNHDPVQQPDGSWIWSYSVNITGSVYSAELHGQFITEGVHWGMNISKQGEYEDFLWYYGENDLPATAGFWILKKSPDDPTDFIRIDWSRNISAGTYAVKYTNIALGDPWNGNYIDFRYTKGVPYDYTCDILMDILMEGNHTYIAYSSSTGAGRIKDSAYFGDEEWRCWDGDRVNVDCP